MVVAADLDAQLKGIVNVSYAVGAPVFKSVQVILRKAIPLHIACQHFAYDDPFAYRSASRGIAMLTKNHRVRFRSHMGTFRWWRGCWGMDGILCCADRNNFSCDLPISLLSLWDSRVACGMSICTRDVWDSTKCSACQYQWRFVYRFSYGMVTKATRY